MKRTKLLAIMLVCAMTASVFAGCGSKKEEPAPSTTPATEESGDSEGTAPEAEAPAASDLSVALVINGNTGDNAFNDLAVAGFKQAQEEFGIDGTVAEMNYETAKYEPTISDFAADPDYDVIVVNSADVSEIVEKVAPQYPDKKFILYDAEVDYSVADLSNVYSVTFKQNEASFLAGALAAKMTSITGDDKINPEKIIGYVAGGENVVINDFLLGYIEGCEYADPDARMLISYVGNFSDTAKGKEMANSQITQNADIIYQVADQAGIGVLEAAEEQGHYAIGVDLDQYESFKDSNPGRAANIMTSVLKRVDTCVYSSIKRCLEGTLPFGEAEQAGVAEEMMALAKNENYEKIVPQDIRDYIDELEDKIRSGEIVVSSNLGADESVINDARDRIAP